VNKYKEEDIKDKITSMVSGENIGALCYVVPLNTTDKSISQFDFFDWDRELKTSEFPLLLGMQIDKINSREWGHDYGISMINPNVHGWEVIAKAFDSNYTAKPCGTIPVIDSLDDIKNLGKVTIDSDAFKYFYHILNYLYTHTQGSIPIEMISTGGPFSTSSLIIKNTALLEGIYTKPEAVFNLMGMCTDLFIDFVKEQKKYAPNIVPVCMHDTWWPKDLGVLCQDDFIINLSPLKFLEFVVPYYNKISDIFGGIIIHCCGEFSHLFSVMRDKIRNLRGIWLNAGECNVKKAVEIFRGTNTVIIPRWVLNQVNCFKDRIDFINYILQLKTPDISMFIQAHSFIEHTSITQPGVIKPEDDHNLVSKMILNIIEDYEKKWN